MIALPAIDARLVQNRSSGLRNHTRDVTAILRDAALARSVMRAWPAYRPTAVQPLDPLARALGIAHLNVKNESTRFGLGAFKAIGGAYAVYRALAGRVAAATGKVPTADELLSGRHFDLTRAHTVTCASAGNHGRAVAWGAHMLGCTCRVYLHADVSEVRANAIREFGATVVRTSGNYDEAVAQCAHDAERENWIVISDTAYDDYTETPRDIMSGYTLIVDEALASGVTPTHVFVQGGVGGLAGAVASEFAVRFGREAPAIIVVEPSGAACIGASLANGERTSLDHVDSIMGGLCCGVVSTIAWDILRHTADAAIAIDDTSIAPVITMLASGDAGAAITAGESGCAGVAAVIAAATNPDVRHVLRIDEASSVMTFVTEGPMDPASFQRLTSTVMSA